MACYYCSLRTSLVFFFKHLILKYYSFLCLPSTITSSKRGRNYPCCRLNWGNCSDLQNDICWNFITKWSYFKAETLYVLFVFVHSKWQKQHVTYVLCFSMHNAKEKYQYYFDLSIHSDLPFHQKSQYVMRRHISSYLTRIPVEKASGNIPDKFTVWPGLSIQVHVPLQPYAS